MSVVICSNARVACYFRSTTRGSGILSAPICAYENVSLYQAASRINERLFDWETIPRRKYMQRTSVFFMHQQGAIQHHPFMVVARSSWKAWRSFPEITAVYL